MWLVQQKPRFRSRLISYLCFSTLETIKNTCFISVLQQCSIVCLLCTDWVRKQYLKFFNRVSNPECCQLIRDKLLSSSPAMKGDYIIYNIYGDLYECMLLDLKNDPCLLTTFCLPNPQYNWRMLTIIAANFHSVEQNFLGRAVSGFRSDDANPPSPSLPPWPLTSVSHIMFRR